MANDTRDYDAFIRHIDALDIELSKNDEGVLTVCTASEPFFCYDAETKEEAAILVGKTLASYGKLFFNLGDIDVPIQELTNFAGSVAVERGTPVGRFKPAFDLAA